MTVLERAELQVAPEKADEFAGRLDKGLDLLRADGGCRSVTVSRGVERPEVFLLLVTWDSVDHHLTFKEAPAFAEFVGLIKDYLTGPTGMEHFTALAER
jgi:quinol monooxygenase YgiN